jgi:hypothetical protein
LFAPPKKWRQLGYPTYQPSHVNALWRMCAENVRMPHRFVAYTDHPEGIECERRPSFHPVSIRNRDGTSSEDGCYPRLRLYDPEVQATLDADFVLILDLDVVLMRDISPLIERCMEHDFTALQGSQWPDGTPCSWYNGSFQLCRTGSRPQFWNEFDTKRFWHQRENYKMPNGKRPHGTDQAWLTVCAGEGENTIGPADGVYQHRTLRNGIPPDTQILFFSGKDKPWNSNVAVRSPEVARRWSMYEKAAA